MDLRDDAEALDGDQPNQGWLNQQRDRANESIRRLNQKDDYHKTMGYSIMNHLNEIPNFWRDKGTASHCVALALSYEFVQKDSYCSIVGILLQHKKHLFFKLKVTRKHLKRIPMHCMLQRDRGVGLSASIKSVKRWHVSGVNVTVGITIS